MPAFNVVEALSDRAVSSQGRPLNLDGRGGQEAVVNRLAGPLRRPRLPPAPPRFWCPFARPGTQRSEPPPESVPSRRALCKLQNIGAAGADVREADVEHVEPVVSSASEPQAPISERETPENPAPGCRAAPGRPDGSPEETPASDPSPPPTTRLKSDAKPICLASFCPKCVSKFAYNNCQTRPRVRSIPTPEPNLADTNRIRSGGIVPGPNLDDSRPRWNSARIQSTSAQLRGQNRSGLAASALLVESGPNLVGFGLC